MSLMNKVETRNNRSKIAAAIGATIGILATATFFKSDSIMDKVAEWTDRPTECRLVDGSWGDAVKHQELVNRLPQEAKTATQNGTVGYVACNEVLVQIGEEVKVPELAGDGECYVVDLAPLSRPVDETAVACVATRDNLLSDSIAAWK